jgi:acylphosphatase
MAQRVAQAPPSSNKLTSFSYEIRGKVQKVFFRKYTEEKAKALGVTGWVMNTETGTVVGEAEGPAAAMRLFKTWLRTTGSPKCRIDAAVFTNERDIAVTERKFSGFERRE